MIHELELVVLARDVPEHALQPGDVGTVVHCYQAGAQWRSNSSRLAERPLPC